MKNNKKAPRTKKSYSNYNNMYFNFNIQTLLNQDKEDEVINLLKNSFHTSNDYNRNQLLLSLLDKKINNYEDTLYYTYEIINNVNFSIYKKSYIRIFLINILLEHGDYNEAIKQLKILESLKNQIPLNIYYSSIIEQSILNRNSLNYDSAISFIEKKYHSINNLNANLELTTLYKLKNDLEKAMYYSNLIDDNNALLKAKSIIYIYIKYNKFNEANDIINKYKDFFELNKLDFINKYINAKLNNNVDNLPFLLEQLTTYDKNKCIEHITKHLNSNEYKKIHSTFIKNFNIKNKYEEFSNKIHLLKPYNEDIIQHYIIDEKNIIGKVNIFDTNKIKLVTDFNKNIINMYPVLSHYEYNYNKSNNFKKNFTKKISNSIYINKKNN